MESPASSSRQPDSAEYAPPRWRQILFVASWFATAAICVSMLLQWLPGGIAGVLSVLTLPLCLTTLGAIWPQTGFLARPVNGGARSGNRIALTFDDGPDPETTASVLTVLRASTHRATFFVIGEKAQRHPDLVRLAVNDGHEVANHSSSHDWRLCFWSPTRIAADLRHTQSVVVKASGARPRWFRPPNAVFSPRIPLGARLAGLRLVGYSARAYDSRAGARADRCLVRIKRNLKPGTIVLMHDTSRSVGPALLEPLLAELDRRALVSVPLSELIPAEVAPHHPR